MLIDPYRFGGGSGGTGFSDAVLALSPWGYWKLDETGSPTVAVDSSGNGRDGTYAGTGTTFGAGGLFTGSVRSITLNGGGRVNFPTMGAVDGQKLSLLCCFKTSAAGGIQQLMSADDNEGGNRVWQWRINGEKIELVFFAVGHVVSNIGDVVTDGSPHMAVLVLDPTLADVDGKTKVYVDGALKYSSTTTITITSTATTRPCYGSRSSELQAESMVGSGDECAAWIGTALSATDVADLWAARNTA